MFNPSKNYFKLNLCYMTILKYLPIRFRIVLVLLTFFLRFSHAQSIVDDYGQLSVKGNYLIGESGDTAQLRGMSLFWSQWMPQYYTPETVKYLKDNWKCTIVRAAMGVEKGGYLENPDEEKAKVITVVDAAIKNGIYVIIDYHAHEAHLDAESAVKFFGEMAKKYGKYPHVIYEIYNEPLQNTKWSEDIKPYAEKVIAEIRKYDPDNLIIVGTRQWSQMVSEAADDPLSDPQVAYTLHFYAATHGGWLREEAEKAMDKGICLFVSEYGTCNASGDGRFDPKHTNDWYDFMDKYKISSCNWSIADKVETASALKPGASGKGNWTEEELTPSGKFVKAEIVEKNTPIWKEVKKEEKEKKKVKKKK